MKYRHLLMLGLLIFCSCRENNREAKLSTEVSRQFIEKVKTTPWIGVEASRRGQDGWITSPEIEKFVALLINNIKSNPDKIDPAEKKFFICGIKIKTAKRDFFLFFNDWGWSLDRRNYAGSHDIAAPEVNRFREHMMQTYEEKDTIQKK